jgi:hypothetical protein
MSLLKKTLNKRLEEKLHLTSKEPKKLLFSHRLIAQKYEKELQRIDSFGNR